MTELAIPEEQPRQELMTVEPNTALLVWAREARQAHQVATSLARTSFVPASMRGKADDITATILAGQELGLKPMASLRSLDIIQGTPALRAHAMRGLVQSHGHKVHLDESTDTRCVMRGRRKDDTEWQTVEWDLDRADKLGLLGKSEWKKQPRTMLIARATGEICRLIASDVLYAMPYASEELRDGADHYAEEVPATTPRVTREEILGQATASPPAAAPQAAGADDDPWADELPWPETASAGGAA